MKSSLFPIPQWSREMATETSNVENILNEIKNDHSEEEKKKKIFLLKSMTEEKLLKLTNLFPKKQINILLMKVLKI
jgi:hypothetical protein